VKGFLTQALVDHQTIAKHRIWDQGDWHRLVWSAFNPVEGDRGPRNFLYSVEETPQGCKALILSDQIPTRPDWCPTQGWTTKAVPANFLTRYRYAFSLTANPTIRLSHGPRISLAKRAGLDDEPEIRLLDWLEHKGVTGGFRIYRGKTLVQPGEVQTFPTSDRSQKITIHYVHYQGILEVTDSILFVNTFNSGIGRAKSYGAGMLLLKPIQ
jgi:CRISPR system Cascade subunit CasE